MYRKMNRVGVCSMVVAMGAVSTPIARSAGDGLSTLPAAPTGVPQAWLTKAERTGFQQTSRYAATVAYCRRLAAASDWIHFESFGVSGEGRDLPLLIASSDGAFEPAQAKATNKPIVLVQNCIHAGECGGKDASLMLLRDIAVTKTQKDLLDGAILLVIPIFNVDGHERFSAYSRINQNGPKEKGWRVTSRNLNLNRDYTKADTVEMRAWLSLWNRWQPDLHIDNHTTNGGDWQYDVLLAWELHEAASPPIVRWLRDVLEPSVLPALEADGHVTMIYFNLVDSKDLSKGVRSPAFGPRFATGYAAVRNRPSILVETHMLKPYERRVMAHYNVMRRTLELVNRSGASLREAVRLGDAEASRIGATYDPKARFPISVRSSDTATPLTFRGFAHHTEPSDISGGSRVVYDRATLANVETIWFRDTQIDKSIAPPLAYVIPPQWADVIEIVLAHGLRIKRLVEPVTTEVQRYRLHDPKFARRPFEGRFRVSFDVEQESSRVVLPAGSVIVPLDQPGSRLAIHLLEPAAPDSLAAWGFFNAVFEQKVYAGSYALESIAREMLAADPKLREEFEAKLAEDAEFAGSSRARLEFFYRRSPYWDEAMGRYPVVRLTNREEVTKVYEKAADGKDVRP
ncbi:MAG: peptidase M14 [Planctomycetes bacterium]|nr:peptidase M14 [Planctomycetota bacterium]